MMQRIHAGTTRWQLLLTISALSLLGAASVADTLHAIAAGGYQHHQSGWIFPNHIEGFMRMGVPQDIDGAIDVAAHYARVVNSTRVTASVDVYPADSAATDASLANAKAAIQASLQSAQAMSETQFKVGNQRQLAALKVAYMIGAGATSAQQYLYFVDTGDWIVKIRATVPTAAQDTVRAVDDFVRGQRWESLELSDQTCTGPACDP